MPTTPQSAEQGADDEQLNRLRLVTYGLYHVGSLKKAKEGGFCYDPVYEYFHHRTEEEQVGYISSIQWALENRNLDYDEVLPRIMKIHGKRFIRSYLKIVLSRIEEHSKRLEKEGANKTLDTNA